MPFEPLRPAGAFTDAPALPQPAEDEESPGLGDALGAAFRTENTLGSLASWQAAQFAERPIDQAFDPFAEIANTPYEAYGETFAKAADREHFDAIKADIDRENKDRDTLSRSGLVGMGAALTAGVLDWPTLLPGGQIVRNARGGVSVLRSAASVGAYGAAGAAVSEGVLQATQQTRTATESAVAIGGGAVLAGLLGAGAATWAGRARLDELAPRVERDFEVPAAGQPDVFEPGGMTPDALARIAGYQRVVSTADATDPRALAVAEAIQGMADDILPQAVPVRVVDDLIGIMRGDGVPEGSAARLEGHYDPELWRITISAGALEPERILRHEAIHALKNVGLIRKPEWATLEAAARAGGWADKHGVRGRYSDLYGDRLDEATLLEEAIAEEFSAWRAGGAQAESGVRAAFSRLKAFFDRLGNALRLRGFRTADDVLGAIDSGRVADRYGPNARGPRREARATSGRGTSAGAAVVERADDALKSAAGLEKAFRWQDPLLRLQNSVSTAARRWVQELAETPLTYEKNALGEPTAPAGSEMGAPGAVETRVKMWNAALANGQSALKDAFYAYRKGEAAQRGVAGVAALRARDAIFGADGLNYARFKVEVSKALRRGDAHEIPEVAKAASHIRKTVLDPLKDDAIKADLLPEGVSVETAPSYLNRLYNKNRIVAERDQFKAVVADWLREQEAVNAGVRERLQKLVADQEAADTAVAKADAQLERRKARLQEVEVRAEEAARIHEFAFRRALDRRESIDKVKATIADLGEQIAQPLDVLDAVRGLDKKISDARAIANSMRKGAGGDLALMLADVADLEEGIGALVDDAARQIDAVAESGDLPLPKPKGRYAGGDLAADEIEDIAGSWRFIREMKARRKPEGLTTFVVRMGGVEDPGGDVRSMLGTKNARPGLIKRGPDVEGPQLALGGGGGSRPNTLDSMALRAWENGFFPGRTERPSVNDLLDALREDYSGSPVLRGDDESYLLDVERADALAADLAQRRINPADFRTEGQLRLYLGQSPRDAFAAEADAGLRTLRALKEQLSSTLEPYRARLSSMMRQARRRERDEGIRQAERGAFAGKARDRGRTLADQAFARRGEIDALQAKRDAAEARLSAARAAIEAEVAQYRGKSASGAVRALEQRGEAEAARAERRTQTEQRRAALVARIADEERALAVGAPLQRTGDPRIEALNELRRELATVERGLGDPARLRGADAEVMSAAKRIAAQIEKEPGEIDDLADEIIDRILGTPDGRMPYDAHSTGERTTFSGDTEKRGPLAARSFMIPDAAIERWLENDIEAVMSAYVRTMAPDVEITRRFGDVTMKAQMKEIVEDYARRSAAAKTAKERKKLDDMKKADIRDLAAIRDRIRGTYALPSNPDGIMVRSGRVISSLNYMRMLGGMTLSAIPDLGGIVFAHGITRVIGDGIVPLFKNWSGAKLSIAELRAAGSALDMELGTRAMSISDVMDNFGRHSKFERAVNASAAAFGVVSLQAPWNDMLKGFAGRITMTRILRASERLAAGKASPAEIERMAAGGISAANARRIAQQFAKHGRKEGGVWFANTAEWDEGTRPAKEAFRAALVREVDRIIITPGQDRPLWMSTETGRIIGQFKSFAIAAMQRVVISGLQQRDAATLNGAILMTALGGLVGILKAKVAGQPAHTEWDDPRKNAQFLVEAIDRSGLTGWLMDANSMTEKLTRGAVGLSAITGKPVSRYAQRNLAGSLLGPSVGTVEDILRTAGAASSGEWNQTNSRVLRRLIPYNNLFYARRLFDAAETGINDFLGVPAAPGAKRRAAQ